MRPQRLVFRALKSRARNYVIMRKAVRKDRMDNDEAAEAKRLGGTIARAEADIADHNLALEPGAIVEDSDDSDDL